MCEIHISHITRETIGHNQIFKTIVVEVGKQRRPAPVSFFSSREKPNFAVQHPVLFPGPHIEMQHISDELKIVIVELVIYLVRRAAFQQHGFFPVVDFGQHIKGKYLLQTIIVDIGHVITHG